MFKEIILPCIFSFIASIAFGIQFNIRFLHIVAAGIGGIVSQFIFLLLEYNGADEMLCYFTAACAISVYSELLARFIKVPVNMYLVIAIIPLVPGWYIYQTMLDLIKNDINGFVTECVRTFEIAGSVAMGIFVVSSAFRLYSGLKKQLKAKVKQKQG